MMRVEHVEEEWWEAEWDAVAEEALLTELGSEAFVELWHERIGPYLPDVVLDLLGW